MRIPESESARWQEEIEEADSNTGERLSDYSSRVESIRGHPSGAREYAEAAAWTSHSRKKQQVQSYVRRERAEKTAEEKQTAQKEKESSRFRKNQETAEQSMEGFREEIKGKIKREQLHKEQKKQAGRLSFGDESSGMIQGAGIGMAKKAVSAGTVAASAYVHGKSHEAEQENAAVEGAHKAELLGEKTVRYAVSRSSRRLQESLHTERQAEKTAEAGRLQFEAMKKSGKEVGKHAAEVEQSKKNAILRFWQKRRYKQAYAAAKEGKKATEDTIRVTETIAVKAKKVLQEILCRNRAIFAGIGVCVLLFAVMAASLSSCSASIQGGSTTIISTTYASEDEDIYAAENAYAQLEAALNNQINSMEATHPEYEEYRYQVDEISHNPYHLISYLTVKYGDFTYTQVASEIEEIFREQYSIHTESVRETVTETQTVRVGESLGQVVTSGYCNCPICCGVWSGGSTASGAMPQANHTIAVDASNPFVPLGTKIVMNGVEYVVEDTGAFIVIDTLQKVRTASKDNAYASDYGDISLIKDFADRHSLAVIVVHHIRKQNDSDVFNKVSGTTGLTGSADATFVLEKEKRASDTAKLYVTGRDTPYQEYTLRFRDCSWELVERKTQEQLAKETIPDVLFRLVDFMRDKEEWAGTATELLAAMRETETIPTVITKWLNEYRTTFLNENHIVYQYSRKKHGRQISLAKRAGDSGDGGDSDIGIPPVTVIDA